MAIEASDVARITAALDAGRPQSAEAECRQLLRGHPDDETALVFLAIALQQRGEPEHAAAVHEKLTVLYPDKATHWNNLATLLRELGRPAAAEDAYLIALRLAPDDPGIRGNLGLLYKERGDHPRARAHLLAAAQAVPEDHELRICAAITCHLCGDDAAAAALVAPWRHWLPLGAELSVDLAWLFAQTGRIADATQLLDQSLRLDGARPRTIARMVGLLERINRLDEARVLLATLPAPDAVSDPADRLEVFAAIAAMALRDAPAPDARRLLEHLLELATDEAQRANLGFALATSCDRMGDPAAALDALRAAHAAQLAEAARLAPGLMAPDVPPLAPALNRMTAAEAAAYPPPESVATPVFVVGFPRSGTTLLEQMLDAHPAFVSMDEQPFLLRACERVIAGGVLYPEALATLGAARCRELRDAYWRDVATVVDVGPGQRLVDKNPLNLLHLPLICRLFPDAPIILALRHPCDVILSCYLQNFSAPAFQIMCASLEGIAAGYVNAMEFWIHHEALFQPRVLHLRYEDLLDDFDAGTARIAAFLGAGDPSALRGYDRHAQAKGYISTPSYAAVTQAPNRSAVGRWRRYVDAFAPLLPSLRHVMEHWGYA